MPSADDITPLPPNGPQGEPTRPEQPQLKKVPNWPDPAFPATVERQTWNLMEDPVTRLGIWLKASGA